MEIEGQIRLEISVRGEAQAGISGTGYNEERHSREHRITSSYRGRGRGTQRASGGLATGGWKAYCTTWDGRVRFVGYSAEDSTTEAQRCARGSGAGVRTFYVTLEELGGVFERPRSSSRHHQQVDPYEGQSLGDDARKGVGRAVSILRSLVRRSGWNGAFCEPVLNSIDSDIGRSGFADIGMSGSLRVFWRSHPEACSGATPG